MKTNILVRKKDMNGARIKNPELREKAEQLLSKIEKCISRLDVFELQKKSIDEVISNVLEEVEGFKLDFFAFAETVVLWVDGTQVHLNLSHCLFHSQDEGYTATAPWIVCYYLEHSMNGPSPV